MIMGLNKKTITIAVVVVVVLMIVGGLLLGILLSKKKQSHIQLEVWPRAADNDVQPFIEYDSWESTGFHQGTGYAGSYLNWTDRIDDFLKEYRITNKTHAPGNKTRVICNPNTRLGENQVCDVPVEEFDPCTKSNMYGYWRPTPCVFLKLNKILDWKPQTYSCNLPENMPKDLKQHIGNNSCTKSNNTSLPENTVWVSCEGESPTDVKNIGPVKYIPRRGFPAYYYPFTNKEGYLSPLVAVHFQKPKTGVVINIECKAWAKNIDYENGGSVHFKLRVE